MSGQGIPLKGTPAVRTDLVLAALHLTSTPGPQGSQRLRLQVRDEKPANFAERPNMPYFWQRQNLQKAEDKALAFSHSFLGVRIECAQCHKHPFDQWTQNDFKSFQAFFEGVSYGNKGGGGKGAPVMLGETVTFASLTKAIKEAVPADPKGGNNQKALGEEFEKRVKAGEPEIGRAHA